VITIEFSTGAAEKLAEIRSFLETGLTAQEGPLVMVGTYVAGYWMPAFVRAGGLGEWLPPLRGGTPMFDTGEYANSFSAQLDPHTNAVVIANDRFPQDIEGILTHGGTIKAKNAPYLVFRIGDIWAKKKSVTIPARPVYLWRSILIDQVIPRVLKNIFDNIKARAW
jgi:hypothetical protein